jgi:hypothetical protein
MELFINNEKASFVLENESNSYEIVKAVGDITAKMVPQQFIANVIIDDQEYNFDDEEKLKKINIKDIKSIHISTNDIYGIINLTLSQIEKFLDILKGISEDKNFQKKSLEIKDSVEWMNNGINKILQIFSIENLEKIKEDKKLFADKSLELSKIFNDASAPDFEMDNKVRKEAENCISSLFYALRKIKKYLVFTCNLPDKEFVLENINNLLNNINKIIPALGNVSLLFQTGEDNDAMNVIQSLSVILEDSIEMFILFKETFNLHLDKFTVKEVSFEEFFKAITSKLKELINAIERKDSVMISDLLEYEFIPNIEEIQLIMNKIKTEAFEKVN